MSKLGKIKARLGAILVMIAGSALIFVAVLIMNAHERPPEEEERDAAKMVAVKEKKKKKKKERVSRPRRRPKADRPAAAPLPQLSSSLSHADLGIPGLDVGALMGVSTKDVVGSESVDDLVMSEDAVDVVPRPVRRSAPDYPARARSKEIEGYVTLRVLIGKRGNVEKIKVVDSSPDGVFDEAAVSAVRGWQFEPALYRGEQVRVWAKQVVRFNLG